MYEKPHIQAVESMPLALSMRPRQVECPNHDDRLQSTRPVCASRCASGTQHYLETHNASDVRLAGEVSTLTFAHHPDPRVLAQFGGRPFSSRLELSPTRGCIRTDSLAAQTQAYTDQINQDPTPFIQTNSADGILAGVQRFCRRILNSHHLVYHATAVLNRCG